jgi:hypothetical protein
LKSSALVMKGANANRSASLTGNGIRLFLKKTAVFGYDGRRANKEYIAG